MSSLQSPQIEKKRRKIRIKKSAATSTATATATTTTNKIDTDVDDDKQPTSKTTSAMAEVDADVEFLSESTLSDVAIDKNLPENESWRKKLERLVHSHKLQIFLLVLLMVDVLSLSKF